MLGVMGLLNLIIIIKDFVGPKEKVIAKLFFREFEVRRIKKAYNKGMSRAELICRTGLDYSLINSAIDNWKHVEI
jgi:hypothetical protein